MAVKHDEIGTPGTSAAMKLMLLGSGELGKEVAIEALRYGLEVIAVDRYAKAPAMQVAQHSEVIDMLDGEALASLVARLAPSLIVPEVEAIATDQLLALEQRGLHVVPSARATALTMHREGIRCLAAEELRLPTSPYQFASSAEQCHAAIAAIGTPCIVKPVMSSSGKGQVTVRDVAHAGQAWTQAIEQARGDEAKVIVEGFVEFDYEITLLTVRHVQGTSFCAPIGHSQVDGDYRESWQAQTMSAIALDRAQEIAAAVTSALGGYGIFGVELFVCGDEVYFSEVSPRPHDTGMVTLISQDLSEFALHVRAILGLPIPDVSECRPSASMAILGLGRGTDIRYSGMADALREAGTELRIFAKPSIAGKRRLAVALAFDESVAAARAKVGRVAANFHVKVA